MAITIESLPFNTRPKARVNDATVTRLTRVTAVSQGSLMVEVLQIEITLVIAIVEISEVIFRNH